MATIRAAMSNLSAKVLNFSELGLGSSLDLAAATPVDSDDVNCYGPRTCLVHGQIDNGAEDLTIKASVHAGTPDFGSPDLTVTVDDLKMTAGYVNTTVAKPFISLQIESSTGTTIVDEGFGLQVGCKIADGEGYHESQAGMAPYGDGTYTLSIT